MIYLIGGPPRCGKTTLARALSRKLRIPHVPADYLMSVISPYIPGEQMAERLPRWYARVKTGKSNDRLYSEYSASEIVGFYVEEAATYWPGIRNFILYALSDSQDFIIEGAQLRPDLVHALLADEGADRFRAAFLYKSGPDIAEGLKASQDPNDWAKRGTAEETYPKIAQMISVFGERVTAMCEEYHLALYDTSADFTSRIEELAGLLTACD